MDNLARDNLFQPVHQEYGTVSEQSREAWVIMTGHGSYRAKRALSCLIRPQVDDRVLLSVDSEGDAYILAVLARSGESAVQLAFDGDVRVNVPHGRLNIASQEGIDLASAGAINTISEELHLNAVKGRMHIQDGAYQGTFFEARLARVRWFAQQVDTLVDRLTQRAKRIYRQVDEFEQVRAGRMDCLVKKLLSFRSRYTIMTAKEDVKVDGERIHIG